MNLEPIVSGAVIIVFALFWIVSFSILYHLTRFGIGTLPKKLSALFLIGGVTLFCIALVLFVKVDLNFTLL